MKYLLENEGLSRDVMLGFILALISNDRPMHEVLNPNLLDQRKAIDNQFLGMTSYDFEQVRNELIKLVNKNLLQKDKELLLSLKNFQQCAGNYKT